MKTRRKGHKRNLTKKKDRKRHIGGDLTDFYNRIFKKSIVDDSGTAIFFGKDSDEMRKYFDVKDLTKIQSITKENEGQNGMVFKLEYIKNKGWINSKQYHYKALLKCSKKSEADNFMYEYYVGQFLNKYVNKLPCFIETYGIYKFIKDYEIFIKQPKNKQILYVGLKDKLEKIPVGNLQTDIQTACKDPEHLCLLTQYIHKQTDEKSHTLREMLKSGKLQEMDLIAILYQIYFSLNQLKDRFTHYDFHDENVLIFESSTGYIEYQFHLKNGEIRTVKSKYLAKIIDYGRCYYHDNDDNNSKKMHKNVCNTMACYDYEEEEEECGGKKGFLNISGFNLNNQSGDLFLLYLLKSYKWKELLKFSNQDSKLLKFLDFVYFDMQKTLNYPNQNSEIKPSIELYKTNDSSKMIYTISDALLHLEFLIDNYYSFANFEQDRPRAGILHIYEDGQDMIFDTNMTNPDITVVAPSNEPIIIPSMNEIFTQPLPEIKPTVKEKPSNFATLGSLFGKKKSVVPQPIVINPKSMAPNTKSMAPNTNVPNTIDLGIPWTNQKTSLI